MCAVGYIADMTTEPAFPVSKLIRISEEMAERISKRRYDSRQPSENATIRQLLKFALDAADRADAAKAAKTKPE